MTAKTLARRQRLAQTDAASNDSSMASVDRRQLLVRTLWGSVGAAVGMMALPSEAEASDRQRVVFEVACLGNTFSVILAPGASPTDPFNQRGSTFIVEGNLYRRGTIPVGVFDWDPSSATPIGHWFCRGWSINRTGRAGEEDRPEPFVIVHQDYIVGRFAPDNLFPADQIATSGITGTLTAQRPTYSVVGGIGRYFAAHGSVTQNVFGANITGAPNFTCDFRLVKHD
ncbi:MAG: hypothetical protein AUH43_05200 [Acidobacteria bacterium 13_1_40CM_65_14]|nr:MAG: hypothetical protein AUH43_05200 [Acidobacteria bacterium 13_1_40CM_65_14]OLC80418.1 MAG: hypothetical protein AUH72_11665 [Acidobacteria bacterium 13_1_40CM_4_65_8]OLE79789.1 MAG: hypothetical protein AUF76_15885 [Acidobacteria bacterium 13_1_20CM_2_65_9]